MKTECDICGKELELGESAQAIGDGTIEGDGFIPDEDPYAKISCQSCGEKILELIDQHLHGSCVTLLSDEEEKDLKLTDKEKQYIKGVEAFRFEPFKNINGGFVESEVTEIDEKTIKLKVSCGVQDMGDGEDTLYIDNVTLDREKINKETD